MNLIDLSIVLLFLLITFIIGIIDRKKITLEDYWVNGRRTGTIFLIATIFSTFIGVGAILGHAGIAFSGGGLATFLLPLSFLAYFLIFYKFFAPKIREFGDKQLAYTMPDFLEARYSPRVRVIGAIVNLITFSLYVALQILGIGIFVNTLTGFNPTIATIIGGAIVITYTSIGGLRADIRTDIFQSIIMLSLLFIFLPILIIKGGGINTIASLPKEFLIGKDFAPLYVIIFAFFFGGAGVLASADLWQRAYSAKNKESIRKSGIVTTILIFLFIAMAVLFGIYGKILLPDSSSNTIVADLLRNFVPVGLYGLILAGFFAAIMSSADTMILINSMTLVRDIYQKTMRKELNHKKVLKLSRKVTVIVGTLGLIIALLVFNIVHLAIEAITFYVVLLPSIIFGFYWKKANSKAAFWSILIGLIVLIAFLFISPIQAFIPATIVSFITFILIVLVNKQSKEITWHG